MMKKDYLSPEFEIIKYSAEDVLVNSSDKPTDPDGWEEQINKP